MPVPEQPVVADTLHSGGQGVQQKAADKFVCRQRHDFLLVVVGVVLPTEADVTVFHVEQAVIGDGDPMGVSTDVIEHLCGAGKGRFGMDHPFFFRTGSRYRWKASRFCSSAKVEKKCNSPLLKACSSICRKQRRKKRESTLTGQEEV